MDCPRNMQAGVINDNGDAVRRQRNDGFLRQVGYNCICFNIGNVVFCRGRVVQHINPVAVNLFYKKHLIRFNIQCAQKIFAVPRRSFITIVFPKKQNFFFSAGCFKISRAAAMNKRGNTF